EDLLLLAGGRVPPRSTLAAAIDRRIADILLDHGHLTRALPHLRAAVAQEPDARALAARLEDVEQRLLEGPPEEPRPLLDRPAPPELAPLAALEPERCTGTVESYFPDRGFGFLRRADGST